MFTTVLTQSSMHRHAWRHSTFWRMLGADLLLVGFTAMIFPDRTGVGLALMIAAVALASFALNYLLVPVPQRPLSESHDTPAKDVVPSPAPEPLTSSGHPTMLIRRSLQAHEAERSAIAEQLRATAAQQLTALTLHLSAAIDSSEDQPVVASLEAARGLAGEAAVELAALADQIAPAWRGEFGLVPALGALQQRVAQRGLIECDLRVRGEIVPIGLDLTRAILRVADVAIENVERHAGGRSVTLDISFDWPIVRLEVSDDAKGFDLALLESGQVGLGLFRAKELLAHEGGTMQIESAPGCGTRVLATADISHEAVP